MSTWRVRSFAQKTSSLSGNVYGVSLVVKFSKYVHAATRWFAFQNKISFKIPQYEILATRPLLFPRKLNLI